MSDLDPVLLEAFMRVSQRKQAVGEAADPDYEQHIAIDPGDNNGIFIGTDLPPDQIAFLAVRMAKLAMAAMILDEIEIPGALTSQWIEGFLVGLELAKLREAQARNG